VQWVLVSLKGGVPNTGGEVESFPQLHHASNMASDPNSIADLPDPKLVRTPPSTYGLNYANKIRSAINTNSPGPFAPAASDGVTKLPNRGNNIVVDFTDPERFMDASSMEIRFQFQPFFYKYHDRVQGTANLFPYPKGASPILDQSILALIKRITIGNAQGLVIEEITRHNLLSNMILNATSSPDIAQYNSSFSSVSNHTARRNLANNLEHCDDGNAFTPDSGYLTEIINAGVDSEGSNFTGLDFSLSAAAPTLGQTTGQVGANVATFQSARNCVLRLSTSSFLNRNPMIPLFLYRNGLRLTIELEDPRIAFFNNFTGFDTITPNVYFVPFGPKLSDDVQSEYVSGARAAATRGTAYTVLPGFILTEQGYQKLPLVPGDRISFLFGTGCRNLVDSLGNTAATPTPALVRNFLNGNDTYQTAFVSVHEVDGLAVNQYAGGVNGTTVYLVSCPFNLNTAAATTFQLRTGAVAASASAHVLLASGTNEMSSYFASANTCQEFDLLGIYVEKTWNPYINYTGLHTGVTVRTIRNTTNSASTSIVPVPNYFNQGMTTLSTTSSILPAWDYSVGNVQVVADFYKPNVNVYQSYVDQFKQPSGIPYVFTRIAYHSFTISQGNQASPNITLPFQFRSLRGILVVITDEISVNPSTDGTSYNFPALSSFMTRGLVEARVNVGATQFPAQPIRVSEGQLKLFQETDIRSLFGMLGKSDYNYNFPCQKMRNTTRNYKKCGVFDTSSVFDYRDTSRFMLGFDLSKRPMDFASGIDTSQGVNVNLSMTFDKHSAPRNRLVHIFGLVDAILTLQNSSVEVRY